jgi:hypothetical protein
MARGATTKVALRVSDTGGHGGISFTPLRVDLGEMPSGRQAAARGFRQKGVRYFFAFFFFFDCLKPTPPARAGGATQPS